MLLGSILPGLFLILLAVRGAAVGQIGAVFLFVPLGHLLDVVANRELDVFNPLHYVHSMKILIVSDSHGDKDIVADAIRIEQPDMVVHAGDIGYEIHQALDPRYRTYELYYVRGNCDTWLGQYGYPRTAEFKIPGDVSYSVFLCHGDQFGVKGGNGHLIKAGNDAYADIVIYGHTHLQEHEWVGNMLLINPGSIGYNRTYSVLTVDEDGNLDVEESFVPEYYHR